jgi:hypothetical protein
MDASRPATSGSSVVDRDAVVSQLNIAEREVCEILRVAKETSDELQKTPYCDADKLRDRSTEYLSLVQRVRSTLVSTIADIHGKTATSESNKESKNATGHYEAQKLQELQRIQEELTSLGDKNRKT